MRSKIPAAHAGDDEAALESAAGGGVESYESFLDLLPGAKPGVPRLVARAEHSGGPKVGTAGAFRPGFLVGGGPPRAKKNATAAAEADAAAAVDDEMFGDGGEPNIRGAADDYLESKRCAPKLCHQPAADARV
jgi:hypothetical protein